MIVKSRVTGKWVLNVFENFQTDYSLPKYKRESVQEGNLSVFSHGTMMNVDGEMYSKSPRFSIVRALRRLANRLEGKAQKRPEVFQTGQADPIHIFNLARSSMDEIRDYAARVSKFEVAIAQAAAAGQTARRERLSVARGIVQMESILAASRMKRYLTEEQVVEFAGKCKKGLDLMWVANFSRPIPADVVAVKVKADELRVFDNYVVMLWDPKKEAFRMTAQEEAAKRDPILFGVIRGSRKLYFVADWVDEDDLTMNEVEAVLGHAASVIGDDPTVDYASSNPEDPQ